MDGGREREGVSGGGKKRGTERERNPLQYNKPDAFTYVCKITMKSSWNFRQWLQAGQDRVFLTVFHVPYLYCQLAKTSFLSAQNHCRVLIKSVESNGEHGFSGLLEIEASQINSPEKTLHFHSGVAVKLTPPSFSSLSGSNTFVCLFEKPINFPAAKMEIQNHHSFQNQVKFKTITCTPRRGDFWELSGWSWKSDLTIMVS